MEMIVQTGGHLQDMATYKLAMCLSCYDSVSLLSRCDDVSAGTGRRGGVAVAAPALLWRRSRGGRPGRETPRTPNISPVCFY